MLDLVNLEVLRGEREGLRVAPGGVRHGADAVEPREVVSELPRARLLEEVGPRPRPRERVEASSRLLEGREDLLEGGAADLPLAGSREREPPLAVPPDDALLLERGEEGVEVEGRVEDPSLLEPAHDVERLLDVAPEPGDEVEEELQQLFEGEERAEQVERQLPVSDVHRREILRPRRPAGRCGVRPKEKGTLPPDPEALFCPAGPISRRGDDT